MGPSELNVPKKVAAIGTSSWLKQLCIFGLLSLAFVLSYAPPQQVERKNVVISTTGGGKMCPAVVDNARGMFNHASIQGTSPNLGRGLENVVLLTAANSGYYDILQNWQFLANKIGLKWVVLAMDAPLFKRLGPSRAILSDTEYVVSDAVEFRTAGFNTLTCNKLRLVLKVVEDCDVDVVFSDSDNIFLKNPFDHDLGRMIRSGKYSYIYQTNGVEKTKPREHTCLKDGECVNEGNTGFYYISRRSTVLKQVIRDTLATCAEPDNLLDDQTLFWNELRKYSTRHCNADEVDSLGTIVTASASSIKLSHTNETNICCLDPFYYPTGKAPHEKMITYHANYCLGKKAKIKMLKTSRRNGMGWKKGRITDHIDT